MAVQKVKVVYVTNVKTRTVVKVTAAVCFTVLACRVTGDLTAPYIVKLTDKLTSVIETLKEPDVIVSVVEVPTTVDE